MYFRVYFICNRDISFKQFCTKFFIHLNFSVSLEVNPSTTTSSCEIRGYSESLTSYHQA